MQNFSISYNGSKEYNEDIAYSNSMCGWVIDAATGLSNSGFTDFPSDGCWFVYNWNEFLIKNIPSVNNNEDLKNVLKKGIIEIENSFKEISKGAKISDLDKPSASISIVYIRNNKLYYFSLSDTTILFKKRTGEIIKIKKTPLEKLDAIAINEMVNKRKGKNLTLSEARENINDTLIKHRLMKNTKNGYWSLEFDTSAIDHGIEGCIDINTIDSILLMSDGFSCILDSYNYYSAKELFNAIDTYGLNYVYKKIRMIENKDFNALKYPRFKKSDDSTCVFIKQDIKEL